MATLAAGFGALALILAAIGLYGLLAYTVARRTSELGIRMALGASRANLIWLILQNALRLLAFGLSDHYAQIFELTRLDEAVGIHNTESDALAAAGAA